MKKAEKPLSKRLAPFILTLFLLAADQLSKAWVIKTIPENQIYKKYFNDFLWICHVRNVGAAFSIGDGLSQNARFLIFVVGCLALMGLLVYLIISEKQKWITDSQKWVVAGILGGGLGTMVDRIFRFKEGVVDFISINMYGFLGMDRWPTFNISDSCVVCFAIVFLVWELVLEIKEGKNAKGKKSKSKK